jgi:hypothetical protein
MRSWRLYMLVSGVPTLRHRALLAASLGPTTMVVYGREAVVEALVRSRAPVTLLSGDSGVGKSTVLAAAQEAAAADAVAPPPRTIPYSGGALQSAVLQALGDAVAAYVTAQGRAREIAGYIVQIADRLALEGARELSKVIGRELLAVVRGRVGDDVGKAFVEYLEELQSPIDESLLAHLTAAVDPGVVGLVLEFADEVCGHLGGQQIVLALDDGDRLNNEDGRLLVDVAERLPDCLRLHVAFSTRTGTYRQQVERLMTASASIDEQQVLGLGTESVATWLADEGLDPGMAADVARVSGGYALHIGDLIAHLKQGGVIEEAPRNELFARHSSEAWQSLPLEVARHARALCVFGDPLPHDRALTFLGLDAAIWGEIQDRLWRARIFSVEVNGQRWFHEQRRQYLANEVLGADERARASAQAVRALHSMVKDDGMVERLGELATLASAATPLLQADSHLAAAVALEPDELALAASLLELMELATPAVRGDLLLDYARSVFGGQGDLIEALRRLGQRDLVVVVQDESGAAAVAPSWGSELAAFAVAGRAVRELGRLPVIRAASAVFELEVLPRIGPVTGAHYGIGRPSMGRLSEMAAGLRRDASGFIGSFDLGSNLLIRGDYAGRDLYAAITFSSPGERHTARQELSGLSGEVFGQRYEINDLLSHPVGHIPSRRFLEAAGRLIGKTIGPAAFASRFISLDLQTPITPEEVVRRKAAILRVVRKHGSKLERMAAGVDEPIGFAYIAQGRSMWEIEIRGGREGVEELPGQAGLRLDDPYRVFRLSELLALRPGEYITHLSSRSGAVRRDPVVDVLGRLHWNAAQFNRHQGHRSRRSVVLDAEWLQEALTQAARRNLEDARALAAAAPVGETMRPPEPRTTHLLIEMNRPRPDAVPGLDSAAHYFVIPDPNGDDIVSVTLVYRTEERPTRGDTKTLSTWLDRLHLPGQPDSYEHGVSDLAYLLAEMLGHTESEIDLVYP